MGRPCICNFGCGDLSNLWPSTGGNAAPNAVNLVHRGHLRTLGSNRSWCLPGNPAESDWSSLDLRFNPDRRWSHASRRRHYFGGRRGTAVWASILTCSFASQEFKTRRCALTIRSSRDRFAASAQCRRIVTLPRPQSGPA